MTPEQFCGLLNGKRVGKGKYMAKCPHHGDKHPSLSIREGNKSPIVFRCMSHGCDPKAILDAMGLTWQDVLGPRAVTPAIRQKMRDQAYLGRLEKEHGCFIMLKVLEPEKQRYWAACVRNTEAKIQQLRVKLA